MGAGHGHGVRADLDVPPVRTDRRAVVVLLALIVPILAASVAGMILLWPHGEPPAARTATVPGATEDPVPAVVRSASAQECEGTSSDRQPDGSIPATALCASVVARIESGRDRGTDVRVPVPPQVYRAGIEPGDRVSIVRYAPLDDAEAAEARAANPDALPDGSVYAWVDFDRGRPILLLAGLFAIAVVLVARLRGVAAVAGLALAFAAVVTFVLPALRLGDDPVAVALVASVVVMTILLYLAHGVSARTSTALLGTFFGLGLTAALAAWSSSAAHLNGLSSEDNYVLSQLTDNRDLSGIVLAGMIIAGLGVLNDVTVTQVSAVWEIRAHAPDLGVRRLFVSGMRVGRDHLASSIYTIAFVYAGAALPALSLIGLYQRPLLQVVTSGEIAEEIVRTLVGMIGVTLAIPVTTALAAAVVSSGGPDRRPSRDPSPDRSPDPPPTPLLQPSRTPVPASGRRAHRA